MSLNRSTTGRTSLFALAIVAMLLAILTMRPALADDRELLRNSVAEPYVFILLDTSGSMHWTPKCTQAQFDANECEVLCPTGDCYAPLNGDDPNSKFYQAKEALYEVIKGVGDVQFGFATYNQDGAYMRVKHYLYKAKENGPNIVAGLPFPAINSQDVLGMTWTCTSGSDEGCNYDNPAESSDAWEMQRVRRVPKGGISLTDNVTVWVRHSNNRYRIVYDPVSGSLGSDVRFNIDIDRCLSSGCTGSNRIDVSNKDVTFEYVNEFGSWDNGDKTTNPRLGFFNQGDAADPNAANTCAGWDPNAATPAGFFPTEAATVDRYNGYNIRFPTVADPRGAFFSMGDIIPLDWNASHQQDILNRLAPNVITDPGATPDFRSMAYFKDNRLLTETFLRLENEILRPLIASGSTPLGNSVKSFRYWWAGCTGANCPAGGWEKVAAAQDPQFSCRKKFLLVVTDGDESCAPPDGNGADPCTWTKTLFDQENIKTFVVAFGVDNVAGNKLECMASNGGSGDPIYPQNKQELINALNAIFGQIREEVSAFASAAVPSVQAEVADRIFLSSFTPLNAASVWDGHLDAYLKPLPLTPDGKPDVGRTCPAPGSPQRSSCHLWDAGKVITTQASTWEGPDFLKNVDEPTAGHLKLGLSNTERRVFYGMRRTAADGILNKLKLFVPPQTNESLTDNDWLDLWLGLKIPVDPLDLEQAGDDTRDIIKRTLAIKPRGAGYLLGDIFHSDPAIIDRPSDFSFYSSDLFDNKSGTCTGNPSYRCFADKNQRRRKMLVVGSNDGQLHFFDAGTYDTVAKKFSDGTGKELFSFIPRLMMPVIRDLAQGSRQIFGIDATPRIDDVYLDPEHNGTPTPGDREWRSLVIGGVREGGSIDANGGHVSGFVSGYYALDITKPDATPVTQVVPTCLNLNNTPVSTACGTLPYPALLWEFTDSIGSSRWDEDSNGSPDLGQTWSVPTVGRIRVTVGATVTYRFVAIFGGGFDPLNKTSPRSGNWLYMVDIETGKAIYKRQLVGAVPSDPAVLDENLDGFLDTIYIGTTGGLLYKVDLRATATLSTVTIPRTRAIPALAADPQVQRIQGWDPFPVFNTGGRPIFYPPTVFYVAKLNQFALAFGTGNREDLWAENDQEGRFYVILDQNFTVGATGLPRTEANYQRVTVNEDSKTPGVDFLATPQGTLLGGWYLQLEPDERIITQAFGLTGIIVFSSFQPKLDISTDENGVVCARGGDSRIFVVYANTANPIMSTPPFDPDDPEIPPYPADGPDDGEKTRYRTVPEFVTNPYVEQGSTKNLGGPSGSSNSEVLDEAQKEIMETVKQFFPPETKFANYWISVSGIRSDTGYERYATIPVGIIQRNWKEH